MKPLSLKMLKRISFVPGLNLLCLPAFIYNSFFVKFTFKDYLRSWKYLVFPAVFLVILHAIVVKCFPTTSIIYGYIHTYLLLTVVGLRLTKYQENYF